MNNTKSTAGDSEVSSAERRSHLHPLRRLRSSSQPAFQPFPKSLPFAAFFQGTCPSLAIASSSSFGLVGDRAADP